MTPNAKRSHERVRLTLIIKDLNDSSCECLLAAAEIRGLDLEDEKEDLIYALRECRKSSDEMPLRLVKIVDAALESVKH